MRAPRHTWTIVEVNRLRELYPKKTMYQIARLMNKTYHQIEHALVHYGIRKEVGKNAKITEAQRHLVLALRDKGHTYGEISIKTGIKPDTVRSIVDYQRRKYGTVRTTREFTGGIHQD